MSYKFIAGGIATLLLSLAFPGTARACLPPLPMTAAQEEARELQIQAELWARHDLIFAAVVTAVGDDRSEILDPGAPPRISINDEIRVRLEPIVMVKGQGALPEPYEIGNIFTGCVPQGLARAQVGQRYLIYGPPSSEYGRVGGIVEIDRLKDAETILAVYQAAALAAMGQ